MKGAQVEDLNILRFPLIAFPKIDGFRCILTPEGGLTSTMSAFPNRAFQEQSKGLTDVYDLDGEVTVGKNRGKGVLNRTSSGLTSKDGDPDWHLWVFDFLSNLEGEFINRYGLAGEVVSAMGHPRVHLLKGKLIPSLEQLEKYIKRCLTKGYEGVITRSLDGRYKQGKSTLREQGLLKIKPFTDFEVLITGYFEEMENTNEAKRSATGKLKRSSAKEGKKAKGTLGGFEGLLLDARGKVKAPRTKVRVGGGFTKKQRSDFWAIKDELVAAGAVMKCSKQLMGEKNKPRHPNFLSLRPGWDIV